MSATKTLVLALIGFLTGFFLVYFIIEIWLKHMFPF